MFTHFLGDLDKVKQLTATVRTDETMSVMSQALRTACWNGRCNVVEWLLIHTTVDVTQLGITWYMRGPVTALTAASFRGHVTVVHRLLEEPSDINEQSEGTCDTTLHHTIWCQYEDVSSLHKTCIDGDTDMVCQLLYRRHVDTQDNNGNTPLHYACQYDHLDVVKLLLSVFAQIDVVNSWNRTPLNLSTDFGNYKLMQYLSI
jgi:hypothetical protein